MNQKGFIRIIIIVGLIVLAGATGYFIGNQTLFPTPIPPPSPMPNQIIKCESDSDCPSLQYRCETIQGEGTVCPSTDPSCIPTSAITEGICKIKEGNRCETNSDCLAGLLCNANVCASPITRQCNGPSDISCPVGYECVQGCGWPVPRPDEPPPSYFCQLKGYFRPCPICLAENTLIDTPLGSISVKDLRIGAPIWTIDKIGRRVSGIVTKTFKASVSPTHQMVHLIFDDGRELFVSPGHPTIDGRAVANLIVNDFYDGARIIATIRVAYGNTATYDILPSGETGFYWANEILLDSTLH